MGREGMSRRAVCVASMAILFGRLTEMPDAQRVMLVQCALVPRKCVVHPESAMALLLCRMFAVALAAWLQLFTIGLLIKLPCLVVNLL